MGNMLASKAMINNVEIYSFESVEFFLDYITNEKKVLVAMNAEKILKKDTKLKVIINNNIGNLIKTFGIC